MTWLHTTPTIHTYYDYYDYDYDYDCDYDYDYNYAYDIDYDIYDHSCYDHYNC